MNLLKTSMLSAIETAIKLASGFVVIKYIAMTVGPEGVACFGQFQNFIASFIILVSGCATTGLVCFSAQEKSNDQSPVYLGNTVGLGLIVSFLLGIFLSLFAKEISFLIFKTDRYFYLFYFLSFAGIFIVLFQAILAQLNGLNELVKLLTCKATSSVILLLCSVLLVYFYGLVGGLIALVCMQSVAAFVGIWLLQKVNGFQWHWLKPKFNMALYKDLGAYWLTSLVTLVSTPLILILIRVDIVNQLGWEAAGIWEATWKIAELYLLVITTGLTIYYVPNLSKSQSIDEELLLLKKVIIFSLSAAMVLALSIYLFRFFIVSLLFSKEFLSATSLFKYQLLGSVVKIVAWILAYHMLVKRKIALFLMSELFFGASFYLITKLCIHQFGLIGASYAYFANYCLYLAFCLFYIFYFYRAQYNLPRFKVCLSE